MSETVDPSNIPAGLRVLELADILPVKITVVDENAKIIFANETFAKWLGMSRSNVIGALAYDLLRIDGDDDNKDRLARIRDIIEAGAMREYTIEVRHPDGSLRVLQCKVLPHDARRAVYCFFRDITEARNSEINEAKYRAVVDTAGEGVILMDEIGTIQSFNKTAELLFGYTTEEVVGQNVKMLMPRHHADNHDGYLRRYMETRVPHIIGRNGVEADCLRKDGTLFPANIAVATFNANGKTYFTGIVRDITERKIYEHAVKQIERDLTDEIAKRERALDQIFNLSDSVLGIVGFDGRFHSISPAAERLVGVPSHRVGDRPFLDYVHVDDRAKLSVAYQEAMQGKPVVSFEARVINQRDGVVRWTSWSAQPVPEDQMLVVVGRDITDDRIREEKFRQVQKMEAIGQLTGGIAHDFNNLLAAISGSFELMEKQFEAGRTDKIEKYISAGRQATARAAQLTARLLAFARRQPLAPVAVNLNDLICSMQDLFDRSIGPSIALHTDLDTKLWATICDQNQLENSVLNCVINSRDALSEGGTITIKSQNITEAKCRYHDIPKGEFVMVEVTDDGTGMPESILNRAFDPFFTTKPIGQGTGLGLSMLYGFVNQSNGHVKIISAPGEGTSIRIYLPRTTAVPALIPRDETKLMPQLAQPGQTVLIVEDEELVRDVLVEVMEGCGFTILEAGDADQAIPYLTLQTQRIDLLLSDVGLPGMNGRQLAEIARQHRPDLKVLFITGYAPTATLRDTFLEPGMDMMTKPFEVDAVAERVAKMLRS